MRKILLLVIPVFLSACSTKPINLAPNIPESTRVQFTSTCETDCQQAVMDKFGYEPNNNIWGNSMFIKEALVVSINNRYGPNNHYDPRGVYNSTANGKFQIYDAPGETKSLVRAAPIWSAPKSEQSISFQTKTGHKYFLGNLRFRESIFTARLPIQYRWLPLVVDLSEMKVIHPDTDNNWLFYYMQAGEPDWYEPTLEELNEFEYKDHDRINKATIN